MCFSIALIKALIRLCSTSFDLGSDLVNSLSFLGYSITSNDSNITYMSTQNYTGKMNCSNDESENTVKLTNMMEAISYDKIWGTVGILIMFLPGIMCLPAFLLKYLIRKEYFELLFNLVMLTMYPIFLLLYQIFALILTLRGNPDEEDNNGLALVALEAFIECSCQLALQSFTILYGNDVDLLQLVTMSASFVMLAKTSIEFDIMARGKKLNFKQSLMHLVKMLPCYVSTIVFRISSITLTLAYLRLWAIIPISTLFMELALISYLRYRNMDDKFRRFEDIYYLCISNVGVLNAYSIGRIDEDEEPDNKGASRFIRYSSIIVFLHHTFMLIFIANIDRVSPGYLEDKVYKDLILKPNNVQFNWAIAMVIVIGFYGLMLSLALAKKIANINVRVIERSSLNIN